jgi:hypothetical protein
VLVAFAGGGVVCVKVWIDASVCVDLGKLGYLLVLLRRGVRVAGGVAAITAPRRDPTGVVQDRATPKPTAACYTLAKEALHPT